MNKKMVDVRGLLQRQLEMCKEKGAII